MHQRTRERQLLLHTSRQRPSLTVLKTFYLRIDSLNGVITLIHRRSKECGKKLQILLYRQILIQRESSRHISYALTDVCHLLHHIETVHRCRTFISQQQRTKNAIHRRLTRSVWPDESEDLALAYRERHILQSLHFTIRLRYSVYFNTCHDAVVANFSLFTLHLKETSPYMPIFT